MTDADADRPARVGFVASSALGGAVVRNRVKRRLRAAVARRIDAVPAGVDLVVRANSAAAAASFGDLDADVERCLTTAIDRLRSRVGG